LTPELSSSFQSASTRGGYRPGYEIAAERILEYIVKERLSPGIRLPTEKVADAVQMNRTVVREAVKILSAVGRLSVQKGRGIYVADPEGAQWQESFSRFLPADLRQVDEMFEFRRYVETATACLAAQRAALRQVNAIREAAVRSMEAALDSDIEAFTRADEGFPWRDRRGGVEHVLRCDGRLRAMSAATGQCHRAGRRRGRVARGGCRAAPGDRRGHRLRDDERAESLMAGHIDMTASQFRRAIRKRLLPDSDASS
jgi:DNA-binding GntR family transcriptional regulator